MGRAFVELERGRIKSFSRALVLVTCLAAGALGLGCSVETDADVSGAGAGVAEETSEAITGTLTAGATLVTTSNLNLRAEARTTGRVIATMPDGSRVTAVGGASVNGFYRVKFQGQEGFAFGTHLERDGAPGGAGGSGASTTRTVTLLWQGNWAFLTQCDSCSRERVTFACQQFLHMSCDFVDNDFWLAAPGSLQGSGNRLCGRRVEVCKNGICRTATIVERSVESSASTWEGSTRLIKDLGGDPGFTSCSRSFGTVAGVTVRY